MMALFDDDKAHMLPPSSQMPRRIRMTPPIPSRRGGRNRRRSQGRLPWEWFQEAKEIAGATGSHFLKGFFHEHDRDVADDRVDAMALHALQALLDHRLLAAKLVAELVAHRGPPFFGQRHRLHFLFAERARQDFEQFGVDGHPRRSVASRE